MVSIACWSLNTHVASYKTNFLHLRRLNTAGSFSIKTASAAKRLVFNAVINEAAKGLDGSVLNLYSSKPNIFKKMM